MKSMLKRRQKQLRRVRRLMFLQLLKRVRNSLRLLKEKQDLLKTRQPEKEISSVDSEEVEAEDESDDDDADLASMTVSELKDLLRAADKPVSGKKADLITRLQE